MNQGPGWKGGGRYLGLVMAGVQGGRSGPRPYLRLSPPHLGTRAWVTLGCLAQRQLRMGGVPRGGGTCLCFFWQWGFEGMMPESKRAHTPKHEPNFPPIGEHAYAPGLEPSFPQFRCTRAHFLHGREKPGRATACYSSLCPSQPHLFFFSIFSPGLHAPGLSRHLELQPVNGSSACVLRLALSYRKPGSKLTLFCGPQ